MFLFCICANVVRKNYVIPNVYLKRGAGRMIELLLFEIHIGWCATVHFRCLRYVSVAGTCGVRFRTIGQWHTKI